MNSRLSLALALNLVAAQAFAQNGEEAYRSAAQWTVQVRTSVSEPFIEDEEGTWFGAGLLVDGARGWILTNAHVAGHSYGKVNVAFEDGKAIPARRVYVDPYLDIAVLAYDTKRVGPRTVTPTLDCTTLPPVGHPVGAFGHPWGFRFTGTRGIISAVTTRMGPNMLQTDAPINEGNSGGPLISLDTGEVVGVNTAKIKEEAVEGLSFAVPMPYACTVLNLLEQGRDPSPPDHLVDFARDDNDEQTMVIARSRLPAGTLDLRVGDEIVAVNSPERRVVNSTDLVDALRGHLDQVSLRVKRDGRELDVAGHWPAAAKMTERRGVSISGALIAEAEPLTLGLIAGNPALMVHHVAPGSEAESAGLAAFDLLMSADGQPLGSLDALLGRARGAAAAGQPIELMLLRIGSETQEQFFIYQRRLLPVEDTRSVGPSSR